MWLTRTERIGFVVVLAPAVLAVLLAYRPNSPDDVPEFDAVAWREHAQANDGVRTEQAPSARRSSSRNEPPSASARSHP